MELDLLQWTTCNRVEDEGEERSNVPLRTAYQLFDTSHAKKKSRKSQPVLHMGFEDVAN